jgi:hypothetical protein
MKSLRKTTVIILMALLSFSFVFQSCDEESIDAFFDALLNGWLVDKEEMDDIPEDITPFDGDDTEPLQTKISLEHLFPPIGDQGQYGTCVVWSVGYNLKTALNAIEKGWTQTDLAKTSNQTSPKDLWMAIPSGKKGSKCNGTNFEPALDALISSGAASLSSVPYTGLGNCDGTKVGDANNKITNYRKIASENSGLTVDNFKGYLNAGRPISIGAKLGDRFMAWDSPAILSSDTYNNPGMQHAYHAMVLVGYDDDKNAFRVRNSWGATSWGDNGSIWVDYNFFCKEFCFAAFVAQNVNDVSVGTGGIEGDLTSGYDLLAYYAYDAYDKDFDPKYGARSREFSYDIYNSGTETIYPSQRWTVAYLYYNAVNANDYQIIFEDYYTDEFGQGDDFWDGAAGLAGGWWNNASVASGKKAGETEFPDGFIINYIMPEITGKYYLVVMADSYDVIREANEDNNFYFITAENGKPLEFQDGVVLNMPPPTKSGKTSAPAPFSNTENQTVVKPGNLNAYTPAEIRTMLLHDKKTGKLDMKMKAAHVGGMSGVKVKK